MIARPLFVAAALFALTQNAFAQGKSEVIAAPALRANVVVTADIGRIGELIDNAGPAGRSAIYRAPDPGTTGTLAVSQVINTLRAHQVFGVDAKDLREISVTRQARSIDASDIGRAGARARGRRGGRG